MIRIGLVDLCTSHPGSFVPIIREQFGDLQVVAVWDGGSVRPAGYAKEFAKEHQIEATPDALEELVALVDAGIMMIRSSQQNYADVAFLFQPVDNFSGFLAHGCFVLILGLVARLYSLQIFLPG